MDLRWRTCFRAGITVIILFVIVNYWKSAAGLIAAGLSAAMPLIIGCCMAYVVNILMSFYERKLFGKHILKTSPSIPTPGPKDNTALRDVASGKSACPAGSDFFSVNDSSPSVFTSVYTHADGSDDDFHPFVHGGGIGMDRSGMVQAEPLASTAPSAQTTAPDSSDSSVPPVSVYSLNPDRPAPAASVPGRPRMAVRIFCIFAAYITIVLIAFLIVSMIIPELVNCFEILEEQLPAALDFSIEWMEHNLQISELLQGDASASIFEVGEADWRRYLNTIIEFLFSGFGGAVETAAAIVSSVVSKTVTLVLAFMFSIYLLAGKEKLAGQFHMLAARYIPDRARSKLNYVLSTLNRCFHNFIVGQFNEAIILGILCAAGMALLRLPYAAMIGCLIGFTALIPLAGAYIGGAVGAFLICMVSPVQALIFLVFLIILQQLENNLIYPRVVGSSIGLPGIWVLTAITIGGGVLGICGMLIGVPLTAAIYTLIRDDVYRDRE